MSNSNVNPDINNLYNANPPPLFSFAQKTQKINWDALDRVDIDKELVMGKDLSTLERLLANITMSQLSKDDLKVLKDKNLIKLFKLGQLATEYMMYQQQFMDSLCQQVDL